MAEKREVSGGAASDGGGSDVSFDRLFGVFEAALSRLDAPEPEDEADRLPVDADPSAAAGVPAGASSGVWNAELSDPDGRIRTVRVDLVADTADAALSGLVEGLGGWLAGRSSLSVTLVRAEVAAVEAGSSDAAVREASTL